MGRRGPPKKPTALKTAAGNPGRRPLNKQEPKPERTRPACPRWLDADAKACWRDLAPQLDRMGVLTKVDRNALSRYCRIWSRWKRAEQFIQKHGEAYPLKDENGKVKYLQQFPQVATAHKAAILLLRLEQEFGLTPASRPNIVASGRQPGDELDDYAASKWRG